MKIRTDYVTNSSSASSVNITIDNPVLLEILQRYKDMGVFNGAKLYYEIGKVSGENQILAFSVAAESDGSSGLCWRNVRNLEEVISEIINVMEGEMFVDDVSNYDQQLFEQMKNELSNRKDEINRAFLLVDWKAVDDSYGSETSPGYERFVFFHYDPIDGEKLIVNLWGDEEDED